MANHTFTPWALKALYPIYHSKDQTSYQSINQPDVYQSWSSQVFSPDYPLLDLASGIGLVALAFTVMHVVVRPVNQSIKRSVYHSLTPVQKLEWNSYCISTIHALIAVITGTTTFFYTIMNFNEQAHQSISRESQPLFQTLSNSLVHFYQSTFHDSMDSFVLAIQCTFQSNRMIDYSIMLTCGYLLYDFVHLMHHFFSTNQSTRSSSLFNPLMLLHHVLIVCAFAFGLSTRTGVVYMSCFLINEASTLFLNVNYFMAVCKPVLFKQSSNQTNKQSKNQPVKQSNNQSIYETMYLANAFVLLITFFLTRVVFNLMVLAHIFGFSWRQLTILWLKDSSIHQSINQSINWVIPSNQLKCGLLSLLAVGHVCINLVWFAQLVRAVQRKAKATKDKAKKVD